jgi:hypothetical protein
VLHAFNIRSGDPTTRSGPIGHCIYCDATEYNGDPLRQLAEEHVVPEGLGGTLTIRLASCRCCETAINAFEQPILKTILYAPRIYMGVKRKRRKRPKDLFHIRGNVDGKEVEVDLPVEEIPVLLFLLQLGPPGILCGRPPQEAQMHGGWIFNLSGDWGVARRKHGVQNMMSPVVNTQQLCQFLAKIAHGYATFALGEQFKPLLTDFIRTGETVGRFHLIGGNVENGPPSENLHELGIDWWRVEQAEYALVRIRLFASLGAPTYLVVAGQRRTTRN